VYLITWRTVSNELLGADKKFNMPQSNIIQLFNCSQAIYQNIFPRYWKQLSVLLPEANGNIKPGNRTLESQNPKNS
jgi:hypothetical protein